MKSHITDKFRTCFRNLPDRVKKTSVKSYSFWKEDHHHPSLEFKLVGKTTQTFSVRVSIGWRALCVRDEETISGFG